MFKWLLNLYEEWKFNREFEKKKKRASKKLILLYMKSQMQTRRIKKPLKDFLTNNL